MLTLTLHKKINTYNNLFLLLGISFILLLLKAQICNCNNSSIINIKIKQMICQEFQYNGLSISHLLLWCLIGFLFPNKFWYAQIFGLLFEMLEYIIVYYDNNNQKQDKILKEARAVEIQFKKLKSVIYEMCAELEEEQNPEKKEIILQAIKSSGALQAELVLN